MTSNDPCASPTTATSNSITMTVTSPCTNPTSYTVTGGGADCPANSISVNLSGSETGVEYHIYRGGVSTSTFLDGDGNSLSFNPDVDFPSDVRDLYVCGDKRNNWLYGYDDRKCCSDCNC